MLKPYQLSVQGGGVVVCYNWVCQIFLRDLSSSSSGENQSLSNSADQSSSNGIHTIFSSRSTTFHHGGVSAPAEIDCTELRSSQNTTWYYREMCPVLTLKIKRTSLEWNRLKPRNTPLRKHGYHLGNFFPARSIGSRIYIGALYISQSLSL